MTAKKKSQALRYRSGYPNHLGVLPNKIARPLPRRCSQCYGKGYIVTWKQLGYRHSVKCSRCKGRGRVRVE